MRRFLVVATAGLMLLGAACGSGGDGDKSDASNADNKSPRTNAAALAAGFTKVCGSEDAVTMGLAGGQSAQATGTVNYSTISDNLRAAADAAPSELKDDFSVLVNAETPFFQALAKANGNYMAVAQDPAFQAAAEKLSSTEVQLASRHIAAWFESHCKG